jgi:hypothetical protein
MKKRNKLILEFTEFNMQRFNDTSVRPSMHVDDRNLSTNAFDKHQDSIRAAMTRIKDIMNKMSGSNAYKNLRSKLALDDQDIRSMRIQRIVKSNNIRYDVYLAFSIGETEYWGVVEDIMGTPEIASEVFRDIDLYQSTEWVIKIKGMIIKILKEWLKPEPGSYRAINEEIICYSNDTGKQLKITSGLEIEVVRSHHDRIIIEHDSEIYSLVGDNYVYFNWWFEKI